MKFQNPSFKTFLNGWNKGKPKHQYAHHFSKKLNLICVTGRWLMAWSVYKWLHMKQEYFLKDTIFPYKNEKVAAMLRLCCGYLAAIRYVCDDW